MVSNLPRCIAPNADRPCASPRSTWALRSHARDVGSRSNRGDWFRPRPRPTHANPSPERVVFLGATAGSPAHWRFCFPDSGCIGFIWVLWGLELRKSWSRLLLSESSVRSGPLLRAFCVSAVRCATWMDTRFETDGFVAHVAWARTYQSRTEGFSLGRQTYSASHGLPMDRAG